ncbi:MAG: hypothetical protein KGQ41_06045 [Alphaproteobacteria bacterium]|nr:hypothetical protein [Alphaproteobacteria bacterium]
MALAKHKFAAAIVSTIMAFGSFTLAPTISGNDLAQAKGGSASAGARSSSSVRSTSTTTRSYSSPAARTTAAKNFAVSTRSSGGYYYTPFNIHFLNTQILLMNLHSSSSARAHVAPDEAKALAEPLSKEDREAFLSSAGSYDLSILQAILIHKGDLKEAVHYRDAVEGLRVKPLTIQTWNDDDSCGQKVYVVTDKAGVALKWAAERDGELRLSTDSGAFQKCTGYSLHQSQSSRTGVPFYADGKTYKWESGSGMFGYFTGSYKPQ